MPTKPLPQEILDHIVDYVAHDTPESLQNVASTSRRFLERSRRYLFRNIYFAEPLRMAPVTWKILHRNPSMFKYGRRMIIRPDLPAFRVTDAVVQDALSHSRS
ncbi:hypothetical protein FA13DRAFT_3913 [Coprinellus micaceus]|uniref:F-box domain-containing protein n=1 Tax=Coprinellus micaceus TaxID=71717 RepID=A0A4Y7TZ60_COPMI|nr:hypothetical protein FA13DRAFT_3913 [Coprinellus micaceus]